MRLIRRESYIPMVPVTELQVDDVTIRAQVEREAERVPPLLDGSYDACDVIRSEADCSIVAGRN